MTSTLTPYDSETFVGIDAKYTFPDEPLPVSNNGAVRWIGEGFFGDRYVTVIAAHVASLGGEGGFHADTETTGTLVGGGRLAGVGAMNGTATKIVWGRWALFTGAGGLVASAYIMPRSTLAGEGSFVADAEVV